MVIVCLHPSVSIWIRPFQATIRYTWMKAYDNHFKVEDLKSNSMQTFDNGIASVFDMLILDAKDLSLNFIEVLKDIQTWLWSFAYSNSHF